MGDNANENGITIIKDLEELHRRQDEQQQQQHGEEEEEHNNTEPKKTQIRLMTSKNQHCYIVSFYLPISYMYTHIDRYYSLAA